MDLNVSFFGVRNSDFTQAMTNFSAVIPLYFTKPSAANGAADRMQIHDTVSVPTYGFKRKKTATATAQAHTEKMICRSDRPKNTASV